ncbi:MAG: hypothetical protein DME33_10370 [Verrucomicrobia bacterium]|nr:MAG: hypothetical protein DME33_10370 [Verrucomicrobiota bacterium]
MQDFSRKRAILIGVDEYEHVKKLRFCGNDARNLAKAFRESLEFEPEDILEFTLGSVHKPNRAAILHEFGAFLKQQIAEDELLVLYFSGHGMMDQDDKRDYLLPMDASPNDLAATGIAVEHFVKKLTGTGCKNIAIFIDACRQEIREDEKAIVGVGESSREAVEREGLVSFFSCDPKELSFEIEALGHGSFTYCLLQAIEKGECPTVELMDKYLRTAVPLLNKEHGKTPQQPFTVIKPLEKSALPLFYSHVKREAALQKRDDLLNELGRLFIEGILNEKMFDELVNLVNRTTLGLATLPPDEASRVKYMEALIHKRLSPVSFEVAWNALERLQVKPSSPAKLL